MKRTLVFLTVVAALVLTACTTATTVAPTTAPVVQATTAPAAATNTTAPTAVPQKVEINFWSWVPNIQDQVDEWNAANP